MLKLVAFRVLQFPLILAVIYLLTLLLAWVAPGNPFSNEGRKADPIVLDSLKRKFHAESAWSFLTYYPWNAVTHGDFGPSMGHPEWPVTEIIRSALPISVTLRSRLSVSRCLCGYIPSACSAIFAVSSVRPRP